MSAGIDSCPYAVTRLPRWNYARTYRVDSRMALTRRKAKRAAKRYWPLGAAAVGLLALVLAWMLVPAAEWIDSLGQKVAELGWAGPIIYFVPPYSTRYRKAKASKGLTGSFGDRSWPRKAII